MTKVKTATTASKSGHLQPEDEHQNNDNRLTFRLPTTRGRKSKQRQQPHIQATYNPRTKVKTATTASHSGDLQPEDKSQNSDNRLTFRPPTTRGRKSKQRQPPHIQATYNPRTKVKTATTASHSGHVQPEDESQNSNNRLTFRPPTTRGRNSKQRQPPHIQATYNQRTKVKTATTDHIQANYNQRTKVKTATTASHSGQLQPEDESQNSDNRLTFRPPTTRGRKSKQQKPPHIQATYNQRTKVKTATTASHSGHLQPEDESQNSDNRLTFRPPTTRGRKSKQQKPPHIQATYNQRTKVKTATTASHSGHLQPEDESQNRNNRLTFRRPATRGRKSKQRQPITFRPTTTRGRKSKQRQPPHIQATYNQRTKVKTATTASHSGHLQPEDESQNSDNRLTFRPTTTRGQKSKQRQPPHIQATYNQRTKVKTAKTASHSGYLQPEDESQNSDNRLTFRPPTTRGRKSKQRQPTHIQATYNQRTKVETAKTASHSGYLQREDESQNSDNRLTFRPPTTRGQKSKQQQPPHIQATCNQRTKVKTATTDHIPPTYNQRTKVKTATTASHSGHLQPEDESQNSKNRLTFRLPTTRGRKSKQRQPPHIQDTYNQRTKVKTATTASHSGHLQPEDESQNIKNRLTFRLPTTRGRKSKQRQPPHIQATYNQRTKVKTATTASHSGDLQPEDESQNSDNRSHSGQLQPEDESQNSDNRLTFRPTTTRGRKSKQRQPPHIQATYNQRTKVKTATTASHSGDLQPEDESQNSDNRSHSGQLQPEDESQNSDNRLTFRPTTTRGRKSKQRQPPHIQATYNQRTKVKTAKTASHSGYLQREDESQTSDNRLTFRPPTTRGRKSKQRQPPHIQATYNQRTKVKTAKTASHSGYLQREDESQNSDNRLTFRPPTTRGRKSKQRQPPHIQANYNQRTKVKTATTASHSGHLQPEDESQNSKNRLTFRLPTTRGRKSKQRQPPHIQATYNQRTKVKTATTASHSGHLQPEDESQNSKNRLTFRLPTTRGRKSKQRQPPHIQATYNQRTKVKTATTASHSGDLQPEDESQNSDNRSHSAHLQPEDESQNSDNRLRFRITTTRGRKSKQRQPPHIQATYNQRTKVKTATTASHSGHLQPEDESQNSENRSHSAHLQPEDESQNSDNRLRFRITTTRGRKSKQRQPPHIRATYNQRTKVKTATTASHSGHLQPEDESQNSDNRLTFRPPTTRGRKSKQRQHPHIQATYNQRTKVKTARTASHSG